jgi:hypothetical protein
VALLDARGFGAEDFARSHPGGTLGRRLLTHVATSCAGDAVPAWARTTAVAEALLAMTRGGMGMTAVVTTMPARGRHLHRRRPAPRLLDLKGTPVTQVMTRTRTIGPDAWRRRADDGQDQRQGHLSGTMKLKPRGQRPVPDRPHDPAGRADLLAAARHRTQGPLQRQPAAPRSRLLRGELHRAPLRADGRRAEHARREKNGTLPGRRDHGRDRAADVVLQGAAADAASPPCRDWSGRMRGEVALVGDVRGVRAATAADPEIVFTTTHLTVFPDDEVARTNAAVTITREASVIRGVGMEADNKTQLYQLHSQVNSTIEKKRR